MILDAIKFTNSLFLNHFSKFFVVVFPLYVMQFFVYLAFSAVPGNEFGTPSSPTNAVQQILSNLLTFCLLYTSPSPRD